MAKFFDPGPTSPSTSFGLLLLRLGAGGSMIVFHGWDKLAGFAEKKDTFPDPLGMGNSLSLGATVGAEFVCAALIVLGFATRIAALPLAFTMGVAAFVVHADDPWAQRELALFYLAASLALVFTGAGRISVDARLAKQAD